MNCNSRASEAIFSQITERTKFNHRSRAIKKEALTVYRAAFQMSPPGNETDVLVKEHVKRRLVCR